MKNFNLKKLRLRKVNVDELDDRTLLLNLYLTQFVTLVTGLAVIWFQGRHVIGLLSYPKGYGPLVWGVLFAALVLAADLLLVRWVPDEVTDDGGINEKIFRSRPLWHIAVLSFVVAVCEEVLFRGAIQHAFGPYWTSIVFAAIHVRYLRHWIMTGLVFSISYGLGWIYLHTGTLWTPILAHFVIDFVMGCIIRYRRNV